MYGFEDFMSYFANHHYCMKTPEKKTREAMAIYFDGVEPERVDLITRKVKALGFSIDDAASGGYFSYFYRTIKFPFRKARETAFHELGHAIDFIRVDKIVQKVGGCTKTKYDDQYCSSETVLSTGKTLNQMVRQEVKPKINELYNLLCEAYHREVMSAFSEDVAKEYILGRESWHELKGLRSKLRRIKDKESAEAKALAQQIRRLEMLLSEKDYFKAVDKIVDNSPQKKAFRQKYLILSDMLSGYVDSYYMFAGHSRSYMAGKCGFGCEFFADMFEAETTQNYEALALVKQYLPKSFAAYREVYAIARRRICEAA